MKDFFSDADFLMCQYIFTPSRRGVARLEEKSRVETGVSSGSGGNDGAVIGYRNGNDRNAVLH